MRVRTYAGASIFGLTLLLAGCSGDDTDKNGDEGGADLEGVVYVGRTTDEALEYLLDRTPEDRESQRLVIDSPAADATLSKDEPPVISYHNAVTGQLERRPAPSHYVAPAWTLRARTDLSNLFGPVRAAHAHGTPFNGLAYFLEVDDADGNHGLRVFTDQPSYTPESVAWAALSGLSQPLRLTIVLAIFEENEVLANSGPYLGGSIEFRVE
jgi:hypothetical protein